MQPCAECFLEYGLRHPVVCVSHNDAAAFCSWLSGKTGKTVHLPTEAEWEYACRADSKGKYCFGDDDSQLRDYAWYFGNSNSTTHPVGQKKPNAWGLYDMHGNVGEWCSDWYADSYANASNQNPQGPVSSGYRVLRGGGWSSNPQHCRSASRYRHSPGDRVSNFGFRVAVDFK